MPSGPTWQGLSPKSLVPYGIGAPASSSKLMTDGREKVTAAIKGVIPTAMSKKSLAKGRRRSGVFFTLGILPRLMIMARPSGMSTARAGVKRIVHGLAPLRGRGLRYGWGWGVVRTPRVRTQLSHGDLVVQGAREGE